MIKRIIICLVLLTAIHGFAQKNNASPYSFFGVGDENLQKTVEEFSMGKIGVAFNSPYQFTLSNPASFAHLRVTAFSIAGFNRGIKINDGNQTGKSSSAGLSYLAMGIPVGTKAGFSFGIQPNSAVGYSLSESLRDADGVLTSINAFEGSGGTNKVFFGFGYKILPNFSLGIQGNYIFGKIDNTLLNRRNQVQLSTMHQTTSKVSGAELKVGAQYHTKITDKLTLRTGATIDFSNELKNNGQEYLFSLVNIPDAILPKDTLVDNQFDGFINKPMTTALSAGIGQENKWYLGLEYSFKDAIQFSDTFLNQNTNLKYSKGSRISFGGYYTPKIGSVTSYWDRVTYRGGVSYENTGLMLNNTTVNDFGISFGVGLPVGNQSISNVNFGFELGQRGKVENSLIKENYFNFRLSLTLTDKWFVKREIN